MVAFTLRDYQQRMIDEARAHLAAGARSVLIQGPTGMGKTALTAHMLATAARRGKRAWFIVHRRELVKQSSATFEAAGVGHGFVAAGFPFDPRYRVLICSIQTLTRRWHRLTPPDLIVWDECHHVAAGSWSKVHRAYKRARHIGLTATPERLDGAGLGDYFQEMVLGPGVRELIDSGYLSEYRYFCPSMVRLEGIGNRGSDYDSDQLSSVMDTPRITGDALSHYQRLAAGKRAVVFAVNVAHSRHIVGQFQSAGIAAAHVDGETPQDQRDQLIEQFRSGDILVLSNVELFGEGFDLPAIEAAILLRPTQSTGLYLQQVGRALRPFPGKRHAIILDHAGNVRLHGLPDHDRDWRLDQGKRKKKNGASDTPVRMCPQCFAVMPPSKRACPYCGKVLPSQAREVEEVAGNLEELTPQEREQMRRQRRAEQARCDTLGDLIELGKQRGYKNPEGWAQHVLHARQRRHQHRQPAGV